MANPKGNPQNLRPAFKPGESGNPGGKPVGARNELAADFLKVLVKDFREYGAVVLAELRETNPATYIKVIAELLPKQEEKTIDVNVAGVIEHRSVQEVTERISDLLTAGQASDNASSLPH